MKTSGKNVVVEHYSEDVLKDVAQLLLDACKHHASFSIMGLGALKTQLRRKPDAGERLAVVASGLFAANALLSFLYTPH